MRYFKCDTVKQEDRKMVTQDVELTDEEKRKYGSTRDLQAPEEFHDENTEEAEEQIFNGDYESD